MKTLAVASAVFLATAGASTAAQRFVTSRDIKDGTIQLRDISPKAVAQIREAKTTRPATGALVQPGETRTLTVLCDNGSKVTGGGFSSGTTDGQLDILTSLAAGNGWTVTARNNGVTAGGFSVNALCSW